MIMRTVSTTPRTQSRREFLQHTGRLAAASALAGVAIPHVHAAGEDAIRLALIGCGGRGSGAAGDAFESPSGPVKLIAMADFFEERLSKSHAALEQKYADRMDVPPERRFVGFGAWRQAIDCLRPGDVAMLCGYAGWRPQQLEYAVGKGVNVFMEKSFAPDAPGLRRIISAGEVAGQKNLKIASGLMCRHATSRKELVQRIHDGQLGEVLLIRGYRMQPVGALPKRPPQENELQWQIRHFTDFFWVSGGLFAEMNIHQIDEFCWLKNAWPVSAHGVGGRAANSTDCGQDLDSVAVEWTFADGTKATHTVRWLAKCFDDCTTYVHGTNGAARFPGSAHLGPVTIHKDQRFANDNVVWRANPREPSAWQSEWDVLLNAIRKDLPHNEAKRAAQANLADLMARAAAHTGKVVTWDEMLASKFQFCPDLEQLTAESPAPVQADAQGRYPVPVPGQWVEL
jgi:predicted dehydrogenase